MIFVTMSPYRGDSIELSPLYGDEKNRGIFFYGYRVFKPVEVDWCIFSGIFAYLVALGLGLRVPSGQSNASIEKKLMYIKCTKKDKLRVNSQAPNTKQTWYSEPP